MALLIFGKSICLLCRKKIEQNESAITFPPFARNESDICFFFSDRPFHKTCVYQHPSGSEAIRRAESWIANVGPGKRKCAVCKNEVTDPDSYLLIEHLSEHESNLLHSFNYTHLHKSCIPAWSLRSRFLELADRAIAKAYWKGPYLSQLAEEIRAAS